MGDEKKIQKTHLVLSNPGGILAVNKFSDYLRGNQFSSSSSCFVLALFVLVWVKSSLNWDKSFNSYEPSKTFNFAHNFSHLRLMLLSIYFKVFKEIKELYENNRYYISLLLLYLLDTKWWQLMMTHKKNKKNKIYVSIFHFLII